jgi:hypothetical protein
MKASQMKSILSVVMVASACTLASTAWAQYAWIDNNGSKQYSDMPPPDSIPANRILKTPHSTSTMAPATASPVQADAASAAGKTKAAPTLLEQNAEFNKRRAEQAEQEKKAAEQTRLAAEKAKSCDRARQYQKTLASGVRIVSTDQKGERVYLDDKQRGQEQQETNNALKNCS